MDEENFHNEELQIQHFDFSSTEFIANFKERIREDIGDLLATYQKQTLGKKIIDENVVKKEIKSLLNEYIAVRDEVMLVAEQEIKAFFTIPKAAIPHLDWQTRYNVETNESIENLEKEVEELEQQYLKEQTFQKLCDAELQKLMTLDQISEQVTAILNTKIEYDKPMSPQVQKLLKDYDKTISGLTEISPESMQSVYNLNRLFS